MKKTLLIALAAAAGLYAVAIEPAATVPAAQAVEQEAPGLQQDLQERAARLDTLVLTVRGPGLAGAEWESTDTVQTRVSQRIVDRILDRSVESRVGISLGVDGSRFTSVSLDSASDHEGKLFRIHVDRPEMDEDCGISALVMGFYDGLWSLDAVKDQKYSCIRCGEILVCGSRPQCD